jgi:hypothetical protein
MSPVAATIGFRASCGMAPCDIASLEVDPEPNRPLLGGADLPAFRFAHDGGVDPAGMTPPDEVVDSDHHLLLVTEDTEDDRPWERALSVDRPGGEQHRRQSTLHVGRSPPVDPPVDEVGAETGRGSTPRDRRV